MPPNARLSARFEPQEHAMVKRSFRLLPRSGLVILALAVTAIASPSNAQTYPSAMIRIVVGSAAGAPPDIMGRLIASELDKSEG